MRRTHVKRRTVFEVLSASFAFIMLLSALALAAGEKVAVLGGDLTQAERLELSSRFGVDASARTDTVTTQEMVNALGGSGLPVAPTDKSISSAILTCRNTGEGLEVRTENITRVTAPVYANALVTAGVGDAAVTVAAPQNNPVTGETALVGALKAFPQCQGGKQPEAGRVRLAYEQIARTTALAGPSGDLNKASAVILEATQQVITGQARDEAALGSALDSAAAAEGLQINPNQRSEVVGFLRKLGGVDYGTYARGYQVEQVSPNEVRVRPAGAGAPGSTGTGQGAPGTGTTLTGEVRQTGDALTVRSDGQDRQIRTASNVVVTRDGQTASLADIRTGDEVSVTTNPDGTAQRIDATSTDGGGMDWARWLLPLLLALALLGLLLWFLMRRRDKFILERDAAPAQGPDEAGTRT